MIKKTTKVRTKKRLIPSILVAVTLAIITFYYLGYKLTIRNYTNTKSHPAYKLSYPNVYSLVENFDEEESGIWTNCISLRNDNFLLGIAIHGKHHPCYTSTGGGADSSSEVNYKLNAANSSFNVTETHSVYSESNNPEDRNRVTVYGEGMHGMYFVYSDSENEFNKNIGLVKRIISSITWENSEK